MVMALNFSILICRDIVSRFQNHLKFQLTSEEPPDSLCFYCWARVCLLNDFRVVTLPFTTKEISFQDPYLKFFCHSARIIWDVQSNEVKSSQVKLLVFKCQASGMCANGSKQTTKKTTLRLACVFLTT
jgi:hypothetical protein